MQVHPVAGPVDAEHRGSGPGRGGLHDQSAVRREVEGLRQGQVGRHHQVLSAGARARVHRRRLRRVDGGGVGADLRHAEEGGDAEGQGRQDEEPEVLEEAGTGRRRAGGAVAGEQAYTPKQVQGGGGGQVCQGTISTGKLSDFATSRNAEACCHFLVGSGWFLLPGGGGILCAGENMNVQILVRQNLCHFLTMSEQIMYGAQ